MLSLLHIENIAVIEQADLQLGAGFNVLTGETGAGKSIVIDAISAIVGERAYRDMIRTGCEAALVTAVFTGVPELPWFAETGVPYDPEELMISRQVLSDGKNVCKVNGRPVTVTILRQLGLRLINIHGQHDSQQLFDEATHLSLLDSYARNEPVRQAYSREYETLQSIRKELSALQMDEGEKLRRTEMLQHQVDEIHAARLQPGEEEALTARRTILENAEKLLSGVQSSAGALLGDEDSDGAVSLVTEAVRSLSRVQDYSEQLGAISQRLNALMYDLQDAAEELRDLREEFEFSPGELEAVESRLDTIYRLKKKYGGSVEQVLDYYQRAQTELDNMVFAEERVAALEQKQNQQLAAVQKAAKALHASRIAAAQSLQARITSELTQLDMPRVQFECKFTLVEPNPSGADMVCFLMSANIGEALKPLSKVASGGELARIMLAMKNVLAENDAVPTLIFDEVDAGISGRAAQKVADKLADLAQSKQVLCVTHLPQLAARADNHYLVSKHEADGRTFTKVQRLSFADRAEELARIIGGAEITETTRRSAEEMIGRSGG